MASRDPPPRKFTWRIEGFSRLSERKYSDDFTIGGCKWRVLIYPKGHNGNSFSIYLDVPDSATLPTGWHREVRYSFTMVNQDNQGSSTKMETHRTFNARDCDSWGFPSFKPLSELHNRSNGFLVNDTLIVEVGIDVQSVVPPVVDGFESFFNKLTEFIVTAENSAAEEGSGSKSSESDIKKEDLTTPSPSLKEVNKAKQSLKECLSDLFKLNMKDRLSAALSTLSRAEAGLSSDQRESIKNFRENFDEFISDFLTFEQDNAEFELQRLARDQGFSVLKRKRDTHLSNKQLLESLTAEEEELKKRTEEVKAKKQKLISDWQSLMSESEAAQSKYTAQEKKLADAEEKKRIAEERMSRSTAAWSSLKAHFCRR